MNRFATMILAAASALIAGATTASAGGDCRQYVPAVGVTVAVPCGETAATIKTASAEQVPPAAKPNKIEPSSAPVTAEAKNESPRKAAAVPADEPASTKNASLKQCVAILERAERGRVSAGDVQLLRSSCRNSG